MNHLPATSVFWAVLCLSGAKAQVWAPPDATWSYDWNTVTETGYAEMHSTGDTVLGGLNCNKLVLTSHAYDFVGHFYNDGPGIHYYTQVGGELVSVWDGAQFDTLFWFGAAPGGQWAYPDQLAVPPGIITVNDTGTTQLQGQPIHYLQVTLSGGAQDTIFERLGSKQIFFDQNYSLQSDAPVGPLRCYSDQDINFSAGTSPACDFILGSEPHGSDATPGLYPNPASSAATLVWNDPSAQTLSGVATLLIFNAQGSIVRICELQPSEGKALIDLRGLMPGLYTVRVRDLHGRWSTAKLAVV